MQLSSRAVRRLPTNVEIAVAEPERFKEQLRRQLGFLERSSTSYDMGYGDESIRIATTIRVLIHDTRNSTSLLSHLNAKTIKLLTTCPGNVEENVAAYEGLTIISFPGGVKPKLGNGLVEPAQVSVDEWWNQVVFVAGTDCRLTRRDIVLNAADKDGGAHVDRSLTPEYERAVAGLWTMFIGGEGHSTKIEITDSHFMALRQMAYELLNSPDLAGLAA